MVKIQEQREIMRQKLKGIPVDVIHGIQEDVGLVPRIKDYAMNRNVPGLVMAVEVVHMMPPRRNSMVSLPHVEHLAKKFGKVRISHKLGLKAVVADCQRPLQESYMSLVTSSVSALSLYMATYNTRSPSQ